MPKIRNKKEPMIEKLKQLQPSNWKSFRFAESKYLSYRETVLSRVINDP